VTSIFVGHDFFGAGNFGDDLSLMGFLAESARRPHVQITICTPHDRASQRRRFPQVRWLANDDAVRMDALRSADVWLGLGGTPFQLDSGPWLLDHNERERQRCAALGKPMYLLGVGCESPAAAADPRSRALLAAAERVWTRDERSTVALAPFVMPGLCSTGADVAHLAFDGVAAVPPREPDVVGLLLAFERREQLDLPELELFLRRRPPGRTRWLTQEVRALPFLERWILAELTPAARSRLSITAVDYAADSVDDYLRAFGAPDVVITSRYHGALVAARHGSKVVVVTRSAKLRGIADQLELRHIDRVDSHAGLEAAVEMAATASPERLRLVRDRALRMCEAFFDVCTEPAGTIVVSDPLPPESLRATIEVQIPPSLDAGEIAVLPCRIANGGNATYVCAPPNPVQLCYRWYDAGGAPYGSRTWIHTPLPRPLAPGASADTAVRIEAPRLPGRYTLAVTLLQEQVAWFDDVDPASGTSGIVLVGVGSTNAR
jgi:polysaccharide pyruvyl transferase